MQCFHCGAKLDKSDIFCSRCKTPVLTEDDAALVNYQFTNTEPDDSFYDSTVKYTDSNNRFDSSKFIDFNNVAGLNSKQNSGTPQYINVPIKTPKDQFDPYRDEFQNNDNFRPTVRRKKKSSNRLTVILLTLLVCITITGVGLYLLIRPSGTGQQGSQPSGSVTQDGSDESGTASGSEEETLTVSSIIVLSGGRAQTEFHAGVDEIVTLQAQIQPVWIEEDIIWTSSDPDVLEVRQTTENGSEAEIMGIMPGVADIILTSGDFEINFIVYVDNLPIHVQLENAIENSGTSIWLTLLWNTGPNADYETLFKRDPDTNLWIMESIEGSNDINPTFTPVNNALTFNLPTSDNVYYLFADNTGFYGTLNDPDNDTFIWWFITIPTEGEG